MFKNLVLAGGGMKLICILGAIKYLEEKQYLENIEKYYGNSAGSILCMQLNLGFTSCEIINFYNNFDLQKLLTINIDNIFNEFYLYDNTKFEKLIKLFITYKLGIDNINITLLELYNKTKKILNISAVSLNEKKIMYLSFKTFPNLFVWKAVMMSCSIPLLFKPISYNSDLFVDGALIDNFPIIAVPNEELNETLGIEVIFNIQDEKYICNDITDYIYHILQILLNKETTYNSIYNIITIKINQDRIKNLIDVNISKEDKEFLINYGYDEIKKNIIFLFKNKNISSDASTQTDIYIKHNYKKRSNSF